MSKQTPGSSPPPTSESNAPADQFFLNAALGSTHWWRWIVGLVVILLMWIGIGSIVLAIAGCALLGSTNIFGLSCSADGITGDGSLIAQLVIAGLGFAVGLAGIWLVAKLVHGKRLIQVVTGRASFDFNRYLHGLLAALTLSLLLFLFNRFVLQLEMSYQAPGWEFVLFLVVAMILVPIQSGFEEAFFRGYILQGLILLSKNKVVLAVASGVIFALPHLANPEAAEYGSAPFLTALVANGIFFGALALLDGGIEVAAGYHAMNNFFMGAVANTEVSAIETPSLFLIHIDSYELFPNVLVEILAFVLAVALLNFKYKWFKLRSK